MVGVEFVFSEEIDLYKKKIVTGFHGIGVAGYIAVRHMVEKLDAKSFGHIVLDDMPSVATLLRGKVIFPYQLYHKDDLVFLLCYAPIENAYPFAREFVRWLKKSGISEVFIIGGVNKRFRGPSDKDFKVIEVKGVSNRDYTLEYGFEHLEDGLNIVGPLATTLAMCEFEGLPALAILPYAEDHPDSRAAAVAIEVLSEILGLDIDVEELIRDAERIEETVEEAMRQIQLHEKGEDRGMYL
ncbi:MAG: hypothetical protein DRO11_01495 [Methanobacteriota archaeon]|nr:MAG: hypothetical protein DRO11_01495 [Euryarchaeota archaeon]